MFFDGWIRIQDAFSERHRDFKLNATSWIAEHILEFSFVCVDHFSQVGTQVS